MKASPWSILLLAFSAPAFADDLPLNPAVTQETIATTICFPGWTKTVRPSGLRGATSRSSSFENWKSPKSFWSTSSWITASRLLLAARRPSERNLELQPWDEAGEKDRIEACLSRAVCAGTITLDEARRRIWADWRGAGRLANDRLVPSPRRISRPH